MTRLSRASTFAWSPSKRDRKLAWVPVVPFTPRKPRSSRARLRFRRSQRSSYPHIDEHTTFTYPRRREGINLDPERGPLSDSSELGRLVVREAERRHVLVLTREVCESRDHYGDFRDEECEGLAEEDEIRVAELTDVN